MYYPEEVVEEIREKNDIVDIISGYIALKKQGANYFGLCPFHNEKSGSFSVSPQKQMFYCFGCHKGGNVFTFVCEYENFSYPEAIRYLGERAGVKLPEIEYSEEAKKANNKKQTLLDINKDAAVYYYKLLRNEPGVNGLNYFTNRELSEETMKKFGLGFATPRTNDLVAYLKSKGHKDEDIIDSGLVLYNEKYGMTDKFINRVMFPIMDASGKVIGFGGRVMGSTEVDANTGVKIPKYLNSPETMIFDKSRNLYGLNFARTSRKDYFILCEGYMDVIAMHQAGFIEAVASLGTAFTSKQALLIKRYVKSLYFAYDSDEAGVNAAVRAIDILREVGLSGKVINMQPYKDPDEFMKNLGVEEFQKRIDEAENGFIFEIRTISKKFNLNDPDDKTKFHKEIVFKLLTFEDADERDNYLEAVSRAFDINPDNLKKLLAKEAALGQERAKRRMSQSVSYEKERDGEIKKEAPEGKAQRVLLTWLIEEPSLYHKIIKYITLDDFTDELYKSVAERLFDDIEKGINNPAGIISLFQDPEQQRRVAEIFNTKLDAIETDEEKKTALKDAVLLVKRNSFNSLYAASGSENGVLSKIIEARKKIEELQRMKSL